MHRNHPTYASRVRAHAVILSDTGFQLSAIARVYGVCRQTASTWLHDWESGGICALFDKPRSGRPRILSGEDTLKALEFVQQSPRSLKIAVKLVPILTVSFRLERGGQFESGFQSLW